MNVIKLVLEEFTSQSVERMNLNTPRIEKCLALLSEEEIWKRPNDASNSIGNLVLHLCGNITQYIISSIGSKPDNRIRDLEFSASVGYSKEELLQKLKAVVEEATTIINNADEAELMRVRVVQGFNYTGIANIVHVVEHYSYHTGQIALLTKLMKNQDLGFYQGLDLNKKNES